MTHRALPNAGAFLALIIVIAALVAPSLSDQQLGPSATELNPIRIQPIDIAELDFIPNRGQYSDIVNYRADAGGAAIWLTSKGVVYQFTRYIQPPSEGNFLTEYGFQPSSTPDSIEFLFVRVTFTGSNPEPMTMPGRISNKQHNYFIGNDPMKWETNVPSFTDVRYSDIYPGIDLRYFGNDAHMEYDFVVSPGADAALIRVQYDGILAMSVNSNGDLVIETDLGVIVENKPVSYQIDGDQMIPVVGEFELFNDNSFGFSFEDGYNPDLPLIIDPVLGFSTLFGGTGSDYARDLARDTDSNLYITGYTTSSDFPVESAFDGTYNGGGQAGYDIFVSRISASGQTVDYSTYIGGATEVDHAYSIVVDDSGSVYVCGSTQSTDFPTANALQTNLAGSRDAVVFKLCPTGDTLRLSTYFGGSGIEYGSSIDIDTNHRMFVTGNTNSADLGFTGASFDNSLDGSLDGYLAVLNSDGDALDAGTYLGGTDIENCLAVAVTATGDAVVTGYTLSSDFPLESAYDATFAGGDEFGDAFVTRISADASSLVFSTFLGGSGNDAGLDLTLNASSDVFITGFTRSADFPTQQAWDPTFNLGNDAFVSSFSSSGGSLNFSTYIGGGLDDFGAAVAVDPNGHIFVFGNTISYDFPVVNAYDPLFNGNNDVFVVCLFTPGDSMVYSTYLGGSGFDYGYGITASDEGDACVTGYTDSPNFPVKDAMYDTTIGGIDVFLTMLDLVAQICVDSDNDGYGDPGHPENECPDDNCPFVFNPAQIDRDSDGLGDLCDNCDNDVNPNQEDYDYDGIGDSCDACTDTDGDGFGNPGFPANTCPDDNCPDMSNPDQTDKDNDGIGNACDECTDSDGDGFGDPGYPANTCPDDNCPDIANPDQADSDGDGVGNACDNCPVFNPNQEDYDYDGIGDSCDTCTDPDGDGYGSPGFPYNTCDNDNCPFIYNPSQADSDGNGIGDACDVGCCVPPVTGNVDGDPAEIVGISDLTYLVEYMFDGGYAPSCMEEANVDGDAEGIVDISDLTYLVQFLFAGGDAPFACPQ